MHISELLQGKGSNVVTVRPDDLVSAVLRELADHNIGAVVVSSDGRHVDGIASERDVVRALSADGPGILDGPVTAIMSPEVHCASPGDTVDSLMATMTNERVRHIPVLEDGSIVGIVSIGDVVKSRTDELTRDRDALVDYIGAR
jgi:CBS domain-containing protein